MIAAHPPISLIASPARVVLAGRAHEIVAVRNSGRTRVVVEIGRSGYSLDLRGRPRIVAAQRPALLVRVRPARVALAPGQTAKLDVAAALPRHPEPGDHDSLLLLTTRPVRAAAIAVRMRLGVVVVVRVPGRIVHRLQLLRVLARATRAGWTIDLLLANRGNVTERVTGACVRMELRRGGRLVTTLRPLARDLLPRTRGIVEFRYGGRLHGALTAVVAPLRARCGVLAPRAFPLRR
jgi:hypothetical protein